MKDLLKDFRYSVAIRTLGQAGEKYQQELESLNGQTIRPEKIIVYLAEGYKKPKETIGWEKVVYVKKGMIAQRALQYKEIDTPYILMLDDDVYIPEDGVEKLAKGILENNGDCIAADTFPNHKMSILSKIKSFVSNWACPMYSDKWAIKIQHTGSFCYNNNPTRDVYLSQSAAGPCSLWKKSALLGIHFEDELWLDKIGFPYQEDLLFYYKLFLNGGKLLFHYTSGVKHLDAQTSRNAYNADPTKFLKRARAIFFIWWRTDYNVDGKSAIARCWSLTEYSIKFIWSLLVNLAYSLTTFSYKPLLYNIQGNIEGYKYMHSDDYQKIPNFKIASKESLIIVPNTNGFFKFIRRGLEGYGSDVVGFYRFSNSLLMNIIRFFSFFNVNLPKGIVWGKWRKMRDYSTIVLFSEVASKEVIGILEKNNPNARKIYYMWNIKTNIPDYIKNGNNWELWSFDKKECEINGWHYVNQFYPGSKINMSKQKYDFCFCGYNKDRKQFLKELAEILTANNMTFRFIIREWGMKNWISSVKNRINGVEITPFATDYMDYLKLVSQSKCVVDLVRKDQVGLTMRVMESLFLKKKLMTNNMDIVTYPFYCPENVFILGKDDYSSLKTWLEMPMNTNYSVSEYTVANWYNEMGIRSKDKGIK